MTALGAPTAAETVKPRQHFNITLGVLALAALSFALSQTLVIPALPSIQKQLQTDSTTVTCVLTGFLLSASIATPIVGRLGDMFGTRVGSKIPLLIGTTLSTTAFLFLAALHDHPWSIYVATAIPGRRRMQAARDREAATAQPGAA